MPFPTLEEEYAEIDAKNPGNECRRCFYWFLGCLRGRKNWKDEAVTPNIRFEGADGKVYPYRGGGKTPKKAMPLRMLCDGFEADPDPTRLGRAVWDGPDDSVENVPEVVDPPTAN